MRRNRPRSRLLTLKHPSSGVRMTVVSVLDAEDHETYLCGREKCLYWVGQPGLPTMAAAADMKCALVGYAPDETCQAEYLARVVSISDAKKTLWERLADAESIERRRRTAAAARRSAD